MHRGIPGLPPVRLRGLAWGALSPSGSWWARPGREAFRRRVEAELARGGRAPPGRRTTTNGIGMGMAAPTNLPPSAPREQQRKVSCGRCHRREHFYCQLFSEPGAGSEPGPGFPTRAVAPVVDSEGPHWIVNGQKVWTSRPAAEKPSGRSWSHGTDPTVPKHQGPGTLLSSCDMTGSRGRRSGPLTADHRRKPSSNEVFPHRCPGARPPTASARRVGGW